MEGLIRHSPVTPDDRSSRLTHPYTARFYAVLAVTPGYGILGVNLASSSALKPVPRLRKGYTTSTLTPYASIPCRRVLQIVRGHTVDILAHGMACLWSADTLRRWSYGEG